MIFVQYNGPFAAGDELTFEAHTLCKYNHFGIITVPRKVGAVNVSELDEIQINNKNYKINLTGTLEYDNIYKDSITVKFLHDMPAETLVEASYKKII